MATNANTARSLVAISSSLTELSDNDLLASTRRLIGRSNQVLADLLAHLGEVEARGIHRTRACSSLYVYCIYELRLSEDEAYRRVAAARLVRRFPPLFDALASGELHLTGLLMLGPHLTSENLAEVLARARHRTKREIGRLVRFLDPLPAVPARIEPLGPAPTGIAPQAPTWTGLTESFCPVRELQAGERPRDWVEVADDSSAHHGAEATRAGAEPDQATPDRAELDGPTRAGTEPDQATPDRAELDGTTRAGAEPDETTPDRAELAEQHPAALARELRSPERFKVQFTATEEYVRLVEEATALLSHTVPNASLDEVQLRAMRAFVTALRKRRHGGGATSAAPAAESADRESSQRRSAAEFAPLGSVTATPPEPTPPAAAPTPEPPPNPAPPRRRGRHIPAGVRSAVFARDGARCTHVDASGRRCPETRRLEFHHLNPFARGGAHEPSNVTLRCSAHNALAAEQDFGAERIRAKKHSGGHEPLRTIARCDLGGGGLPRNRRAPGSNRPSW